ncbi:MAG: hypothetical protein MUP03_08745 [Anaerolineales bacterium]|nr:hypothetical protein [Anaerolineales bacterium]
MRFTRLAIILLMIVVLAGPVAAETALIDFEPALYVQDFGAGTPRVINNYTMNCDQNVPDGTWVVLGTDDQILFDLVDSRKNIVFTAGNLEQFNLSNTDAYRYYYLMTMSGFPIGSTVDIHFNYTTAVMSPKEQFITPFNWTVKRSPKQVEVFDFSKNPLPGPVNYSITVDQNLAASQSWYLYGSNSLVLGDAAATPTLLDSQSGESFTANVIQWYDISTLPTYKYYILYIYGGFDVSGLKTEVSFYTGPLATAPMVYVYVVGQSSPVEAWHVVLSVLALITIAGRKRMFIRHEKREEDKV